MVRHHSENPSILDIRLVPNFAAVCSSLLHRKGKKRATSPHAFLRRAPCLISTTWSPVAVAAASWRSSADTNVTPDRLSGDHVNRSTLQCGDIERAVEYVRRDRERVLRLEPLRAALRRRRIARATLTYHSDRLPARDAATAV